LTITESTLDGDTAIVIVSLNYSDDAAGVASATGLVPPDRVEDVRSEVSSAPPKTFTLIRVDGEWKISAIR
jgi:hypothetical protein